MISLIKKGINKDAICAFYMSDKYHDSDVSCVSRRLLDDAGVKYTQVDFGKKKIIIDFDKDNV